jgi:iron complex transport system ATP-binding protein
VSGSAAGEPLAELRGVYFAYPSAAGSRPVLDGVDLAIHDGELLTLVGTNGSGKTTLLRLIAGTLSAAGGWVRLFGRAAETWSRPALARRIAVLPQSLELPAGFTVAEIVAMGRAPHASRLFGSSAHDELAVERALVEAEAIKLAHRPIEELSGGERQRVLVAMALAQEPRLLLLDEPTLHLDLAHQVALLDALRRLSRLRGLAIVSVLHDLNLAARLGRRVAVLDGGRIVADGAPGGVLRPDLVQRVFGVSVDALPDGRGGTLLAVRA